MLKPSLVLVIGALATSGPVMPPVSRDVTDYYRAHLMLSPYPATETVDLAEDAQEMISRLKADGLPVSAIAELMRVERKSIYNWLDGGNIQDHNLARLRTLFALLVSDSNQANLRNLYRLFRRPLADGNTLQSLLIEQDLDEVAIRRELDSLWPVAAAYQEKESRRPAVLNPRENPIVAEIPEVTISNGSR